MVRGILCHYNMQGTPCIEYPRILFGKTHDIVGRQEGACRIERSGEKGFPGSSNTSMKDIGR